MIDLRSQSKRPSNWMPSVIFNVLVLFIPLLAANVLISGYSGVPYQGPATADILAETRSEIDRAFDNLSENRTDARANWAALISQQLEARNMSAARGFLLAAPQMLSASDKRAILVAADSDPSGTEDERLLRAALLFVPSDIRVDYEASLRPRGLELITLEEDVPAEPIELADASTSLFSASLASMTHTPEFSVLGTVEDLVSRSRDWMRGNRERAFEMRLTGIAMASPPSATGLEPETLVRAASVLKTAWRSNRLQPEYERLLSQRMAAALPDEALTRNLEIALADITMLDVRAKRVQDAFAQSIDKHTTARLGPELKQIAQIVETTSPRGALSLLEHVETPTDISRARLLAQSGGDRAVALASQIGPEALQLTSAGGIKWNNRTIGWAITLALAFLVMLLSCYNLVKRTFFTHYHEAIL